MEKYPYYQFEKKFSTVIQWRLQESKVVKSSEKENFRGLFECRKTNISVKYAFFLGMFTTELILKANDTEGLPSENVFLCKAQSLIAYTHTK